MNEMQIFSYQDQELRTFERDGELWWVLKDVCGVLGITNNSNVAARLDSDEKALHLVEDPYGTLQNTVIINEPGLYNVILRSDKPEAKDFKRWVTHEVLPSIRRSGIYTPPVRQMTPAELLAAQAQALVELERRTAAVEVRVDRALTALAGPREHSWTEDMKEAIARYCAASGLSETSGRGRLYAALDREANCSTDARLRNLRERKKRAGMRRKDYMAYTKLDAIALDGTLRSCFEGVVARMTAQAEIKRE